MKKNIALLSGGYSGEYEVSLESGKVIYKNIDKELFNVYIIHVGKNSWTYATEDGKVFPLDMNTFSLDLPAGKVKFDAAFIGIHGTPGEDGKIQGYLDLLNIPYNTCGRATSALTFNKYFCNEFAARAGVKTAATYYLHRRDEIVPGEILACTSLPCFVKPNSNGSSVGVTKVHQEDKLMSAIHEAFAVDSEILIQEFIPGVEITCGVYEKEGDLIALPLTEIISGNEFFDYEAKYKGKSQEITPARISENLTNECRELSLKLYRKFNCRGIVRFDYILTPDDFRDPGQFYFLEVNTIPGLSEASIVPQQAAVMGITLKQLFTDVINEAFKPQ